jgi:hypothetical protein
MDILTPEDRLDWAIKMYFESLAEFVRKFAEKELKYSQIQHYIKLPRNKRSKMSLELINLIHERTGLNKYWLAFGDNKYSHFADNEQGRLVKLIHQEKNRIKYKSEAVISAVNEGLEDSYKSQKGVIVSEFTESALQQIVDKIKNISK